MSAKHSFTTADYLPWDTMLSLVRRLYKDGKYRMSLLIACRSFFGFRFSDLLTLTWEQILGELFSLNEKKTGKRREIKVNAGERVYSRECYDALGIQNPKEKCSLNKFGGVISIQRVNVVLKEIKIKYGLMGGKHFSTHSFRKTFGGKVVEKAGENSEIALIKLAVLFNHSNMAITRRYLGLRQQELREVYVSFGF